MTRRNRSASNSRFMARTRVHRDATDQPQLIFGRAGLFKVLNGRWTVPAFRAELTGRSTVAVMALLGCFVRAIPALLLQLASMAFCF